MKEKKHKMRKLMESQKETLICIFYSPRFSVEKQEESEEREILRDFFRVLDGRKTLEESEEENQKRERERERESEKKSDERDGCF